MPKRTIYANSVRAGPDKIGKLYEGQLDLLGMPSKYVSAMVLPETHDPVRVPDEVVATSAVFKAPNIIEDLPFTGSWDPVLATTNEVTGPGETTIFVFPGSHGTIIHSPSSGIQVGFVNAKAVMVNGSSHLNNGIRWMNHGLRVNNTPTVFYPRQRDTGSLHIRVDIDTDGMRIGVKTDPSYTGTVQLRLQYQAPIGVFVNADFPMEFLAGTGFVDPTLLPSVIFGFGIGIVEDTQLGVPVALEFSIRTQGEWISGQNNACMYEIRDIDQLVGMPLTSMERPSALSALVTYMGSTLSNGGNIAVARLPMGLALADAKLGDYYGYLASLPVYAGDFHLKDGCYTWWCPDSEQEYFFRRYGINVSDDITEKSILAITMRRAEPDQTVRLRVDYHCETQTRSALFTSLVSDTSAAFPRALELAKTLPAVTVNHEHEGFLKRAWHKIKDWVSHPKNWANLLTTGAAALTGL